MRRCYTLLVICCCCCCYVTSVVSDSVRPHRGQPIRLPCPWDSPGKNTGLGCHFLLQCMKVKSESEVFQSCPTLRNPMDCSLPGSSVHGILQARVLEWGAIAFSVLVIREMQIQSTMTHTTCPSGCQARRHRHTPPRPGRGCVIGNAWITNKPTC